MKKTCFFLTAIIVISLGFTACRSSDTQKNDSSSVSSTSNGSSSTPGANQSNVKTIQFPYRAVYSPVINGNSMYLSIATDDRAQTDANKLVQYNITTKEQTTIFTSPMAQANIQSIQTDDNWLSWYDLSLDGLMGAVYCKNLKDGTISKVAESTTDEPVIIDHVLYDNCIYWIQEAQSKENTELWGYLMQYNCATKKTKQLTKINEIHLNNVFIDANDGHVVWVDIIDNQGYYFLYDTKTEAIKKYKTIYKLPGYPQISKNYICSIDFNNAESWTDYRFSFFDTKTSKYLDTLADGDFIRISGDYLAVRKGAGTSFYKIGNDKLTLQTISLSNADSINSCGKNIFTAVISTSEEQKMSSTIQIIDFN